LLKKGTLSRWSLLHLQSLAPTPVSRRVDVRQAAGRKNYCRIFITSWKTGCIDPTSWDKGRKKKTATYVYLTDVSIFFGKLWNALRYDLIPPVKWKSCITQWCQYKTRSGCIYEWNIILFANDNGHILFCINVLMINNSSRTIYLSVVQIGSRAVNGYNIITISVSCKHWLSPEIVPPYPVGKNVAATSHA
jgi:hypothetical protein